MAFVKEYITEYICKICHNECTLTFDNGPKLKHGNEIVYVNGYPLPCKNNDKLLNMSEVYEFERPIIS